MVIDEHPFNLVMEELGVISFLAWKQKMTASAFECFHIIEKSSARDETRILLTAQVVNFVVVFVFRIEEPGHLLHRATGYF